MRVALIGSVSSSLHTLRGLLRGGVEVSCVMGLDPAHRAGVSDYVDLRPEAERAGLPYCGFRKIAEPGVAAFLAAHPAELLFVVGLSQLAPPGLIALASAGAVGFHPTVLPKGRGRAPVAWTILLQQPAAANLFFLAEEADAGDIIEQRIVEVRPDDYAQDLISRTNEVLEQMVVDLSPAIRSGTLPRRPQNHAEATWYGKRGPEDGRIDWRQPAEQIYRLIRAVSRPYPGAYGYLEDRKVIIWRAMPHELENYPGPAGQVMAVDGGRGVMVQCGKGALWLTEIEDDGGRRIEAGEFRVGTRLIGGWEGDLRAQLAGN